jgi:muramoyltetrapeptide carboxypeptidase
MLTHWRTAGLLQNLAGVGIGRFSWRPDPGDVFPGDLSLDEVLMDRLGDLGVPVISHLPVGHGLPNKALPMGRRARLDGDSGQLTLL